MNTLTSTIIDYCTACNSGECLVDAGIFCCHHMVQWGYCHHKPLILPLNELQEEEDRLYGDPDYSRTTTCTKDRQPSNPERAWRPLRPTVKYECKDRPASNAYRPSRPAWAVRAY